MKTIVCRDGEHTRCAGQVADFPDHTRREACKCWCHAEATS